MLTMGKHGAGGTAQRKDGRYHASLTMPDGRRLFRYGHTAEEAERLLAELVEARAFDLDPSAQTLAAYLRSWIAGLRDAKRARVRPRTLEHYAMIVERHIIPGLGRIRLDRLTERRVQAWLDADGSAPRTIHHHRAVLRRALNIAVRQRLLVRNPAVAVELPDAAWEGSQPLTLREARKLLETSAGHRLAPLWRLALDTGARQGELLGLAWDDVDLDQGTVVIASQLQRIAGTWVRSAPKTGRVLGRISLAPATVRELRLHQLRQAAERLPTWRYHGLVFVTGNGEPYHGSEIVKAFHLACDRAGIHRRRFHDLRGSTATLMAEAGVPEDARMARLGHTTRKMARHYGQAGETQDRLAAEKLEEALGG